MMITFVVIFPHLGFLPMFVFPFFVMTIVWIYLKLIGQTFNNIGFRFSDISFHSFIYGMITGSAYAAFAYWLLDPIMAKLGFKPANLSDFNSLRHHLLNYVLLMVIAWFIVIPYEEIAFRGFIFSRISAWFKGSTYVFSISTIATSILFASHYQEGTGAVLQILIFALCQMWIYRRVKGNLWYLIFFHIWYDTFMLTAIWRGFM